MSPSRPHSSVAGRAAALVATLSFLAVAGCDTEPLQIVDTLTQDEAEALASALLSQSVEQSLGAAEEGQPSQSAALPGPAGGPLPVTFSNEVEFTAPCPLGGSVAVSLQLSGDVEPGTGVADLDLSATEVHQGCVVEDPDSGRRFTITGDPNLTLTLELTTAADQSMQLAGSHAGRFAWETDERSGVCEISLEFQASGTAGGEAVSGSVSGSVCGVTIDASFSE